MPITRKLAGQGSPAGDAFVVIQTDSGTNPVATSPADVLTITGTDVTTVGNAGTDTVTLNLNTVPVSKGGTGLTALGSALQILRVNAGGTALEYATGGGSAVWGAITGTLSDQTDLQTALNNKQNTLTIGNLSTSTTGVTVTGGTGAVIGSGTTVEVATAGAGTTGLLTSTDWNTFNNKQVSGSYITSLTGDVTATGPGAAAATLATVPVNKGGTGLTSFGSALQVLRVNAGATALEYATISAGTGDVVGPGSSVDNAVVRFDGTTGKLIQSPPTGTTLDDTGYLTLPSAGGYQMGSINDGIRLTSSNMEFWLNSGSRTSRFTIHDTTPHAGITVGPTSAGRVYLGSTNVGANNYIGAQTGSQFGSAGSMSVFAGNNTNGATANLAGDLSLYAGNHASNNAAARGGDSSLAGGNQTHASGVARGGNVTISGGNTSGSGRSGDVIIRPGTAGSSSVGTVQLGRATTYDTDNPNGVNIYGGTTRRNYFTNAGRYRQNVAVEVGPTTDADYVLEPRQEAADNAVGMGLLYNINPDAGGAGFINPLSVTTLEQNSEGGTIVLGANFLPVLDGGGDWSIAVGCNLDFQISGSGAFGSAWGGRFAISHDSTGTADQVISGQFSEPQVSDLSLVGFRSALYVEGTVSVSATDVGSGATINDLPVESSVVRLSSPVTTLNGIYSDLGPKLLWVVNVTGGTVTVNHQSGSATAEDRIITPTAGALSVADTRTVQLWYDVTTARWRVIGGTY